MHAAWGTASDLVAVVMMRCQVIVGGLDSRDSTRFSGKTLDSVPVEFRDALEAYFKGAEELDGAE